MSDTVLAAAVFVLEVVGIVIQAADDAGGYEAAMFGDVPLSTYLLLAASSLALVWRRSQPLLVLGATLALSLVWDLIGLAGGPSLAIFVSLYGAGRYVAEQQTSVVAVAAAALVVAADDVIESEPVSARALSVALVIVPWYLGRRYRSRRAYLVLLEERAEYLERARVAEAQRAVDEERTRIARELHDLVAHRVSMITVQAGAAQTVAASDPERALQAMEAVEEAGREALDELRQVVGVLRADGTTEALGPLHGLAEIPDLVEEMKGAGVDVALSSGRLCDVPAGVDLASYRIVQEALTNVLKHAGPDPRAEVRLDADDELLTIEVTDRGSGVSTLPGSGQGLLGMRERATLLGGSFESGPRLGGGFRIRARLPVGRGPR